MNEAGGQGFERFNFEPAYEVTVDPEFPGSGSWSIPVFAYDSEGKLVDEFRSAWGTPRVVEVRPRDSDPWVGFFPSGGVGGASGTFATPDPSRFCVCVNGAAYTVDVRRPESGATVLRDIVQQVTSTEEPQLLVLAGFTDLAAIDSAGPAWESGRLGMDGLRVVSTSAGIIHIGVLGDNMTEEFLDVDARTGILKDYYGH